MKTARSQLYSMALREYVAQHAVDRVTEALNDVVVGPDAAEVKFVKTAARRALKRIDG